MKQFKHLIKPYIIWASILIVVPLILIVLYAFTSDGNEVLTLHFTWANFAKFLEATYLSVILKSFRLGILTTLICLVCGYPLAYIISKYSEKVQSFLILMVTIPMWINMLLRTYAWMNILSDNGLVNNLLKMLGISPITMMYTDFSVIVGLVCNFMPFMIIPIHTSLSKMDKSLIEAANDLGANPFQTFWRITWKLSMPGVVNGIMMVFLLSISTFVIPKLLGGGQYMLIGNLIESQFISVGDWNFGSAISLILAVIILIFITKMLLEDVKKAPKGEGLHILWMHMMPFLQEPVKDVFNYSQNVHIRACDFVADGFQRMQASDPYEALAEKMVNCIYNGSVKQRIRRAQELANLTEADGGILFAHWGCKGTIGASSLIKNSLENAGLPTMVLDGDGCNPANSSDGQVSTRLQAYLEMLSEGKEEKRS